MEFFKLLEHPEDYLFRTPVFLEWGEGHAAYEEARYPVLSLGDIRLFCNHDTDPDEAIAKWVRRAKKVNLKNVLALLFTRYPQLERRFYGIRGRMRKTCFVPYESGDPRTITITPVPGKDWLSTVMKHAYPGTPLDLYALVSGRGQVLPKTRNA